MVSKIKNCIYSYKWFLIRILLTFSVFLRWPRRKITPKICRLFGSYITIFCWNILCALQTVARSLHGVLEAGLTGVWSAGLSGASGISSTPIKGQCRCIVTAPANTRMSTFMLLHPPTTKKKHQLSTCFLNFLQRLLGNS